MTNVMLPHSDNKVEEVHSQLVDVVLLTQENGSTMLCRGGEDAVRRFWNQ